MRLVVTLCKAPVKGYTRTLPDGRKVFVRPYVNKRPGAHEELPGQGGLFGSPPARPMPFSRELAEPNKPAHYADPAQGSLFDSPPAASEPPQPSLDDLAASSIPKEDLKRHYRLIAGSAALFAHGYKVAIWLSLKKTPHIVYEYMPRAHYAYKEDLSHGVYDWKREDRPRLTATSYREQAAIHRALGLHVTRPGDTWDPLAEGQGALPYNFDEAAKSLRARFGRWL